MLFSFPTERFTEKEQRQRYVRHIFRRVFLEDWGTKLIALGITFALWLGITGLRTPATLRLKNISLITRISNDMEITNKAVEEVEVVLTGDKREIERLTNRDLIVSVDLTEVKPGDRIVQLTPETVNMSLPNGVKLEEIQPNKIAVKLETVQEKEVTIKVETEGNPAEGFEVYGSDVVPVKARVRGAESFVKSLDSISTEKINIEGLKENFSARQIGLNIVNPKVTLLDTIVDVNFRIGEKRAERIFVVPYKNETEAGNVTIVVLGARSVVEKMRTEDLIIDVSKNESGEENIQITLPAELQDKIEILKKKINP
jgi:YbbR domain-containing protein